MRTPVSVRFASKLDKSGPVPSHVPDLGNCWVFLGYRDDAGYGNFWFQGKMQLAHRVSFFLEHGRWPEPNALHRCDNRACNRPSHLFEGTQIENIADRDAKGRTVVPDQRGVKHSQAKLNPEKVREIRAALRSGEKQTAVAKRLGVSRSAINNVANGYCWSDVQ
jgi:DNA-binding XRE family transcriptional regulator